MHRFYHSSRSSDKSAGGSRVGSTGRRLSLLPAQPGYRHILLNITLVGFIIVIFNLSLVDTTRAHGGKTHQAEGITALEAVQTATGLFERLVEKGKLDETWENGLVKIRVSHPADAGGSNYTVSFHRRSRPDRFMSQRHRT